ncbi:ImmA/IrrE family metallo-endopeptidase [Methylacidimicrobium sp. B4]|uniref:helix-turn-helix domain-containing protein n=1 Tax=Methylacidimicrobium sp. B4 TaxID=2796139 RepID=UPI001A8C7E00|nr:XRE family transcriptional regulator [Methylacidimicrobium sp. B4]QSR84679.1 ImmA/IrrE family metallo-endopeptidase [Methylacidimicrobium sp. B4]
MEMTKEELGRRIRSARESCGLTQEQLGESVGLSRVALGQIESGARSVSSLELDRLARALGRDIKSFFATAFAERDALSALFRLDAELAQQVDLRKALQDSMALGRELTNLERLLEIDRVRLITPAYKLRSAKSRWDAIGQGQKVATEERRRLKLGLAPIGALSELLESQGVRTSTVALPENISGLTLIDSTIGLFVAINANHAPVRQRFSLAHEYGHVLMDRDRALAISRVENHSDLLEVRANAFAAEFLMSAEGVAQFILELGKGVTSRAQMAVFDEAEVVQVEQRATPGSQAIQLHDVVLLAHHFRVSRISVLYRLMNLRLIDEREFQRLKAEEDRGDGRKIARFLAAPEVPTEDRSHLRRRFLALAREAYRREEITRRKFAELASMVGLGPQEMEEFIASANWE